MNESKEEEKKPEYVVAKCEAAGALGPECLEPVLALRGYYFAC